MNTYYKKLNLEFAFRGVKMENFMHFDEGIKPLLKIYSPNFYEVEGLIFISTIPCTIEELKSRINKHANLQEAHDYMTIFLLENTLDHVFKKDWSFDDKEIIELLNMCKDNWTKLIKLQFPNTNFIVKVYRDDEYGDLGLCIRRA